MGSDNSWSVTIAALASGNHTLTATETDVAANISSASSPLIVTSNNPALATPISNGTPLSTQNGEYVLDLGTVAQGSGALTVTLATLNSATTPSDLLAGNYSVEASAEFSNDGLQSFSGLAAGVSDTGGQITLSTSNPGTFSEKIQINPLDSMTGSSLPVETVDVVGTVTATGSGAGDIHLITFDGLHYDFQAVGDFTLARSVLNNDFDIQVKAASFQAIPGTSVATELAARAGNNVVEFDAGGGWRLPKRLINFYRFRDKLTYYPFPWRNAVPNSCGRLALILGDG